MAAAYSHGEKHPRAQLDDETVRIIRALRERHGWSYPRIASVYSIPWKTAANFCQGMTRTAAGDPTESDYAQAFQIHTKFVSSPDQILAIILLRLALKPTPRST